MHISAIAGTFGNDPPPGSLKRKIHHNSGNLIMRITLATALVGGALTLAACNMRGAEAGPNSSEQKVGNASMVEPIDKTPLSSTPGAAPDNSTIEPRDPVTR